MSDIPFYVFEISTGREQCKSEKLNIDIRKAREICAETGTVIDVVPSSNEAALFPFVSEEWEGEKNEGNGERTMRTER